MNNEAIRVRIAAIKARVSLEQEMDRRGIPLRSCGGNRLEGPCPFHEDSTPSLSIYLESQQFHCFGCGAHGDVIDFVQRIEGITFFEALQELEQGLGTHHQTAPRHRSIRRSPNHSRVGRTDETPVEQHIPILSMALSIYRQTLSRYTPALSYLETRGISKMTREQLKLGYSDGQTLRQVLSGGAFHAAQQAGLLTRGGKEWFSGRVIIPEVRRGESLSCLWMIGRLLPHLPVHVFVVRREQRYLGLKLPKPLLGYAHAIEDIRERPAGLHGILLVEGAVDYVLARQWRLPAVPVAPLSTHLSRLQWEQLVRLQTISGLPLLDWHDADTPGRLGALSTWDRLDGYPRLMIPEIAGIKDLADLANAPLGFAKLAHAWQGMSDGDAL